MADKPVIAVDAKIEIAGVIQEAEVTKGAKEVTFTIELPAGETTLTTWLANKKGETGNAYFTEVQKLKGCVQITCLTSIGAGCRRDAGGFVQCSDYNLQLTTK